ncbi:subtilisin-like protein [Auricularia subglabra TFB-10046 SS5]|nr:subtilisin-like protein [Auricularia subglabra TFB-10046 SS5]
MRSSFAAFVLLASAASVLAADNSRMIRRAGDEQPTSTIVPGSYIVELSSAESRRLMTSVQNGVLDELDKRVGGRFATRKKYASPIFNGLAVDLKNSADLADLTSIPNVVSISPVHKYPAPKPVALHVASGPRDPAVIPFGQSVHVMTGVDKVHEHGVTGKGVKIGIIDTGIDYTHPSLGGGFGPGFKVAGGYDLVGDTYLPGSATRPPVPDEDPRDCIGHGTHVAGIIGANPGNEFNITGVAHEASLYAYKVFGCSDGVTNDIVIDAMLRAYEDEMDIITMSLGGAGGWTDDPTSLVASRIAQLGTVMTIATGNEGGRGPFYAQSPGTARDVIAVASVENLVVTYQRILTNVEHDPMPYSIYDPLIDVVGMPLNVPETPFPVYALTSDPLSDDTACTALGADVPDLAGYAVVLRVSSLSTCNMFTQFGNVAKKNGRMIIAYNARNTRAPIGFKTAKLRNAEDGIFLVNEVAKGTNLTVTFPQHGSEVDIPNVETGGLTSWFSSFGPTNDLFFNPTISAPGGNISSTWLVSEGSWGVASGTSMATPYMAGSVALLLQTKGKQVAKSARRIFSSAAAGVPGSHAVDAKPHTLAQQGSGLVDVFNALNAQTEVSPSELLLNDTAHWKRLHKITIKNTGKQRQAYELSHRHAGTAVVMPNHNLISGYPPPSIDATVNVRLSHTKLTLRPGASATVLATIDAPKGVDQKTLPLVSGWIRIEGSLGDRQQVSYMGIAGSMYDAAVISTNNAGVATKPSLPAVIVPELDENFREIAQVGPRNYTRSLLTLPAFAFLMAQNSLRVVVDLIKANTKVEATIPLQTSAATKPKGRFDDVPIIDRVRLYEHESRPPNVYWINFPTKYSNGTAVDYGQYRILLRALKPFGNPDLERDYEVYVSEQVGVVEKL